MGTWDPTGGRDDGEEEVLKQPEADSEEEEKPKGKRGAKKVKGKDPHPASSAW